VRHAIRQGQPLANLDWLLDIIKPVRRVRVFGRYESVPATGLIWGDSDEFVDYEAVCG
jgi:hypothetical protein